MEHDKIYDRKRKNFLCSPIRPSVYFEKCREVIFDGNKFRFYESSNGSGPILLLLHGGGSSALTWALFSKMMSERILGKIIAIDLRGHGSTLTMNDYDLSLETLTNDIVNVMKIINTNDDQIVVIGHSMGGALAIHLTNCNLLNVVGVCIIDVVEGVALKSLCFMQNILRNRPSSFRTIDEAIKWALKSGQTKNREAARVSMPGQLYNSKTMYLATDELFSKINLNPLNLPSNKISTLKKTYKWRINLSKTEAHWRYWFEGMSKKFLSISVAKILILSSIGKLDKELNIGNMQGKFQLHILSKCGHAIQEDRPLEVADIISKFLIHNKITRSIV